MTVLFKSHLIPGTFTEQSFRVQGGVRLLEADEADGRRHDLLQFYATDGGTRTVRARDVINIRK